METRLDERVIEDRVIFAARDKGEASHISKHCPRAILAKDMQQSMDLWEIMRGEIARGRRECLAQFRSITSVASVPETAEPVITMGLRNRRARPNDLPTLAPGVARGTHLIQSAKGWGQVFAFRQGALTSRFPRAVDVYDHPGVSSSIHQTTRLRLV
jgi:hypothetical protein